MKGIIAGLIAVFFVLPTQHSFAKNLSEHSDELEESELDRDYRTFKRVVYTGVSLAGLAAVAAVAWGMVDYDYDREHNTVPGSADFTAKSFRDAAGKKRFSYEQFMRKGANKFKSDGRFPEAKEWRKVRIIKPLYEFGYGHAPRVFAAINEFSD